MRIVADEPKVDERIVQLAGTWKAVARRGEGELTTVELVLDNRGWAELTVPGSDGKPATTKSRVNLENEELRLTGANKVVSLGELGYSPNVTAPREAETPKKAPEGSSSQPDRPTGSGY